MRVLLSFPMRIGTTGTGMSAWHQATGLARLGAEVHVVCGSVERPLAGVSVDLETMRVGRQKVPYRLVGRDLATAIHDLRVARMLTRRRREFDVVHAWPSGAERTLRAARAAGVPAFLERPNAHTGFAFDVVQRECERLGMTLNRGSPHAFDVAKLAREEREYAAADALLCPSDFVAATHAARGEPEGRLLRHRYGFDPERFRPPVEPRTGGKPLSVAFMGRLEPRKGVHFALEAWRAAGVGDAGGRLLLCGAVEPGYERVLAPLLEQPGVELVGYVSDPAAVLGRSDALVLPSLEEGSALVTYEARASGAVLLVSDRSGACATDGQDALIHSAGDVAALARHMSALSRDGGLLERLRRNSLDGIGELTWDAAARTLLEAYRTGVGRAGGGRRTIVHPQARACRGRSV